MAVTCEWYQTDRGEYSARLHRHRLAIKKVGGSTNTYDVMVDGEFVGRKRALTSAKTTAIKIAEGRRISAQGTVRRADMPDLKTLSLAAPPTEHIPEPTQPEAAETAATEPAPEAVEPAASNEPDVIPADHPQPPAMAITVTQSAGVGVAADEVVLNFAISGSVCGIDPIDALINLRTAVELLRGFANIKCSYEIPASHEI